MIAQGAAFLEADFRWVASLQSIWRDSPSHVDALQKPVVERIMGAFMPLFAEDAESVLGQPVNGPAGSGKTHLIGTLRRRVWESGGFFVFIDLTGITEFWRTAAFGFIRSLRQSMPDGRSQYQLVFEKALLQIPKEQRLAAIQNGGDLGSGAIRTVNIFVRILQSAYPEGLEHSNVVRALLLQGDPEAAETAYSWLQGLDVDAAERSTLGLTAPSPTSDALVRGISWLMSLSGPTLIAVDQLDPIVTAANVVADGSAGLDDETEGHARAIFHKLANGLMDLYDTTRRSMTVATCLSETWALLREKTLKSALHRFVPTPLTLNSMTSGSEAIASLISSRLTPAFTRHGVNPDNPTWPFMPSALAEIEGYWPREILIRCETYRLRHLGAEKVPPCTTFDVEKPPVIDPPRPSLDRVFDKYVAEANIADLTAGLDDGALLGACLREALQIYVRQITLPGAIDALIGVSQSEPRPSLHARLTFIFHDQKELEKHYCFRVLRHPAAQAVLPRLRAAMTDSGIDRKLPFRHLFIIREEAMPTGPKTKLEIDRLSANGGVILPVTEADLRVFAGLRDMAEAKPEGFDVWLRAKQPLCGTTFFRAVGLCPPPQALAQAPPELGGVAVTEVKDATPQAPAPGAFIPTGVGASTQREASDADLEPSQAKAIPVGRRFAGETVDLQTNLLPRHTAIIAGAGSGKTVLLRRIVEEAALVGIPAIVLDPNNDLSRLGDRWPERPSGFHDEDVTKAERYAESVEVVVWTPGIHAGNPLFLAVLPDFAAVHDDVDECAQAVTMAAATLGPLAGAKANLPKGVLADALRAFAARGGGDLKAMIDLLADLPEGVSEIDDAGKLAAKMANELKAAVATNPLLKAAGPVLDPKVLFFGSNPARTRVSVINLSGLASDEAKQDFVNRLQMTLFGWIKKNPSPRGMLYVLDEAQLFIPSGAATLSKTSGVQLVAQARKYGLGMVAATQAPKGVDNKVVSNCTTQFLGKQNSSTDQQSVKAMIAATGGTADDVGKLAAGEFYFKTDKSGKPFKIRVPNCLSYHPSNPPTPEEVVHRAKKSAS